MHECHSLFCEEIAQIISGVWREQNQIEGKNNTSVYSQVWSAQWTTEARFYQNLLKECVQCVILLPIWATEGRDVHSPFPPLFNDWALTHSLCHAFRVHKHEFLVTCHLVDQRNIGIEHKRQVPQPWEILLGYSFENLSVVQCLV